MLGVKVSCLFTLVQQMAAVCSHFLKKLHLFVYIFWKITAVWNKMTAVCLQFLHEFSVTDESFPISKMVYQPTRRRKTQSCGIRLGYQLGCYLAAVHSGLTLCRANSLPNVGMHVFLSLCNTKINLCGKYLKHRKH